MWDNDKSSCYYIFDADMFYERVILGEGFQTTTEALAPLEATLPWLKQVKGKVGVPESRLIYRHGHLRGLTYSYCISIIVDRRERDFAVILCAPRISEREFGIAAIPWAYALVMVFLAPAASPVIIFVALVMSGIRLAAVWRHGDEALNAFITAYTNVKK